MCKNVKNTIFLLVFVVKWVYQSSSTFKGVTIVCTWLPDATSKQETVTTNLQNSCAHNFTHKISLSIRSSTGTIFENSITNLPNLIKLEMAGINLKEIKPGAIKNVPQLDYLDLGYNALKKSKLVFFAI
ncbi:hypothetical protein Zmor_019070 [Zophobas morio]|uniref:Uncharacterized protein n=1 Tax=Zophobas morio TaxID=2755281 RepID=A0AA38IDF0_9CUCU|nr:hypothetical protein Zmor_019070 [Zophobas morio]